MKHTINNQDMPSSCQAACATSLSTTRGLQQCTGTSYTAHRPSSTSMSAAGCSQSVATGEQCLLALLGLCSKKGLLSLDPSNCSRPADSSASKLPGAAARCAAAKCSTAEARGCSLQASTAAARPSMSSKVNCRNGHAERVRQRLHRLLQQAMVLHALLTTGPCLHLRSASVMREHMYQNLLSTTLY